MHHLETLAERGSKGRGLTVPALLMPSKFPRRPLLGFSVNSPRYKLTCSVPLIVGGSPWLKGVWSNIPLKVPVPPEGMVVPSTLPPRTLISATISARVPSAFHRTAPPVKEPKIVPRSPSSVHSPPTMLLVTSGPGEGGV